MLGKSLRSVAWLIPLCGCTALRDGPSSYDDADEIARCAPGRCIPAELADGFSLN